jgi:hypothetical protein
MPEQSLPKDYRGYSTDDLLAMSDRMQKTGSLEGATRDKILAMRMLENEYRLVPELQTATR